MTYSRMTALLVALCGAILMAAPATAQSTAGDDWTARMSAAHRILDGRIEQTLRQGMAGFDTMVAGSYPEATVAERAAMTAAMQARLPAVIEQIQDMAAQMAVQRFTLTQMEDPALQADAIWAALPPALGDEVSRLARRLGARVIVDACEAQTSMSAACTAAMRDAQVSLSL